MRVQSHGKVRGRLRYAWPQGHVGTTGVVMVDPFIQQTSQVVRCQRNHVIQTFPPKRADEPFTDGIGLRRPERCVQHPQPQVAYALVESRREDAVSVMDEEAV